MSATKLLSKNNLRDRGWTHRLIKAQEPDGTIATGKKGRPKFGYKLSAVVAAEKARSK